MHKREKTRFFRQQYSLAAEDIDELSEKLEEFLRDQGIEQRNRFRIRLSMEESALRMRDKLGEDEKVVLTMGYKFGKAFVEISQEGDIYNPLSKTEADMEDWSGTLLTSVGIYPQFSYSKGKNIIRLILPHHGMNPALKILIAMVIGLFVGLALSGILTPGQEILLQKSLLNPLYDLWIRILSVISGPVVFLMVLTTTLNSGGIEEEGGDTKAVTRRYFVFSFAAAFLAVLATITIPQITLEIGKTLGMSMKDYFPELIKIVPEDAISPLEESNTPQILLMAFMLGYGTLVAGEKADHLKVVIRQANMIGLLMAEWISRLVPYFAAALLCYQFLWEKSQIFHGLVEGLVLSFLISMIWVAAVIFHTARRQHVPMRLLVRKVWPGFVTTIRSGGLDDSFGEIESCCIRKLGIERHYTQVSLPHGVILYLPINVIGTLVFTIIAAHMFGVTISPMWLIIAIVLAVVLFVATPPVPGANLLAYIMIFEQLGVPSLALINAMIFDIIFGIFANAGNQLLLQMDMIMSSDKLGLLDKETLRAEN